MTNDAPHSAPTPLSRFLGGWMRHPSPQEPEQVPDAAEAKQVTGYERGTITPFGSTHPWPVFADSSIVGRSISMGGGAHGVGVKLQADDAIAALDATVADLTAPSSHAG